MLVLSRKLDESIIIGDDIVITVVDVKGEQVKIGISAPKNVSIHRKEVYEAIQEENRAAAASQMQEHDLQRLTKMLPSLQKKSSPFGSPKNRSEQSTGS